MNCAERVYSSVSAHSKTWKLNKMFKNSFGNGLEKFELWTMFWQKIIIKWYVNGESLVKYI